MKYRRQTVLGTFLLLCLAALAPAEDAPPRTLE